MIHLVEVNQENWRLGLKVAESQRKYVSDSNKLLARAYVYRNARSCPLVIYDDETPVGMALYYDWEPLQAYDFSQLFIDERYQGKGYGKIALQKILDMMRADGRYGKVLTCYIEGNDAAKGLYESFGFSVIDRDEDEIIMEMML